MMLWSLWISYISFAEKFEAQINTWHLLST